MLLSPDPSSLSAKDRLRLTSEFVYNNTCQSQHFLHLLLCSRHGGLLNWEYIVIARISRGSGTARLLIYVGKKFNQTMWQPHAIFNKRVGIYRGNIPHTKVTEPQMLADQHTMHGMSVTSHYYIQSCNLLLWVSRQRDFIYKPPLPKICAANK